LKKRKWSILKKTVSISPRDVSRTNDFFNGLRKLRFNHNKNPIDARMAQAATKWKRVALEQFGMKN
jgi:aspartate--ammonia ligase